MKKVMLCGLVALGSICSFAQQEKISDGKRLRAEFEAYKKASEARISQLETKRDSQGKTPLNDRWVRALMGFEFHGYFRAGYGVNGNSDTMEAFKAPNAGAKYRLGNEAETYIEATFQQNFLSRELLKDDVDFFTLLTFAYVTPTDDNNSFETTTSLREAYAGARGVWGSQPDAMFWAGNRFYEHISIHINDFFFRDMAGFGGGLEDLDVGNDMKFAIAWLGGSIDDLTSTGAAYTDNYHLNKNTLDLRLYKIKTGVGSLALYTDLAQFGGDEVVYSPTSTIDIKDSFGWAVGASLKTKFTTNVENRLTAQYGAGASDNFMAIMTAPKGVDLSTVSSYDPGQARRLRITDDIVIETGNPISLQAIAVYEHYDNGMSKQNTIDWFSVGARPIYHFTKYFSLAFEGGIDYTNQEDGPEGVLGKFTLAPQVQLGRTFFGRPVIRMFATYAVWSGSDSFEDAVAPVSYGNETQGLSFGVQMEAWW